MLQHITSKIEHLVTNETQVFADLDGKQINGTTIPADVLISNGKGSKPDVVLINRKSKEIALMELTCSLPRNAQTANSRKLAAYIPLEIALTEKG